MQMGPVTQQHSTIMVGEKISLVLFLVRRIFKKKIVNINAQNKTKMNSNSFVAIEIDSNFTYAGTFPGRQESHGGDDVAVFALGNKYTGIHIHWQISFWFENEQSTNLGCCYDKCSVLGCMSHLFAGVYEQSTIPHLVSYASCLGDGLTVCKQN